MAVMGEVVALAGTPESGPSAHRAGHPAADPDTPPQGRTAEAGPHTHFRSRRVTSGAREVGG